MSYFLIDEQHLCLTKNIAFIELSNIAIIKRGCFKSKIIIHPDYNYRHHLIEIYNFRYLYFDRNNTNLLLKQPLIYKKNLSASTFQSTSK